MMEKTVTMTREQLSQKCAEVIDDFMNSRGDEHQNEGNIMLLMTLVTFSGIVVGKVFDEEQGNE